MTERSKRSGFGLDKMPVFSFFNKALWFLLIGGSGFFLNYAISYSLAHGPIAYLWYIHATIIGIAVSITTNFLLNKILTFKDRNFGKSHVLRQYFLYILFSLVGATIQLFVVYMMVETGYSYAVSLLFGVGLGAFSNFILNKKWTFREKIWS